MDARRAGNRPASARGCLAIDRHKKLTIRIGLPIALGISRAGETVTAACPSITKRSCRGACVRIRYIGLGLGLVIVLWWLAAVAIASARGRKISKCPHCQSTRVRPSWPRFADYILFPAYIRAYRCEACQRRFYGMKGSRTHELAGKSRDATAGSH
jgi:hypothetical protein